MSRFCLATATIAAALLIAGCGHKLVATGGKQTVVIYPDQAAYDRIQSLKNQGGPIGGLGGLSESLVAKQLDDQTPVKIISSNDQGAEVQVLDGPNKGEQGFVPKNNVD